MSNFPKPSISYMVGVSLRMLKVPAHALQEMLLTTSRPEMSIKVKEVLEQNKDLLLTPSADNEC